MENKKFAVVTGASKGIGLCVSDMLSRAGYHVFGLSRTRGANVSAEWIQCDVSSKEAVGAAYEEIFSKTDRIDVLVCNAGFGISGAAEFTDEEAFVSQLDINFNGAVRTCLPVIDSMRKNGGGKIIFISSLGAIFPLPFQSFYSAGKAALNCFSDALGIELAPFNIETCAIMLNDVKTDFTAGRKKSSAGDDIYGGRIEKSVSKMEKSEQNGESPQEIADAVGRLLKRKKLPSHKIVGASNELLGFLCKIFPTDLMLFILAKIYG